VMGQIIGDVKHELEMLPVSSFITKWILEHTPYIFDEQDFKYIQWRESLAGKLKIDTCEIVVTGSASLGFSLNPNKNFKAFDDKSDVDVSIISDYYFDVAWHDLLHLNRPNLPYKMKLALDDHRSRLIYWGTIATDKILPLLSFGQEWENIINESRTLPILEDRDINFRIYRDTKAIRDYLSLSVTERRNALLEAKTR